MVNSRFKFRAWFNLKSKMVESENLAFQYEGDEENPLVFAFDKTDIDENGNEKGTMNFILMQYTCLKDRNCKEIYEGDIVETDIGKGVVVFDSASFLIRILEDDEYYGFEDFFSLHEGGCYLVEVIGNIFEHKHLLEGTE